MTEIRSYEQANEYLGKKDSRPLRYKTRVNRRGENIAITHHVTDIITYQPRGNVIIDTQGWHTSTTKERLNAHLPYGFRIYQEDSIWYLSWIKNGYKWEAVYNDGMQILPSREVLGEGPDKKELKKLNKEILKYSRNYIKALFAGKVGKPSGGDCWFCVLRTDDNKPWGEHTDTRDHLQSHMEEKYYVPSLLVRAIEVFPVSKWAGWALEELWGEMQIPPILERPHTFVDNLAKQQLRSSLKRYLRRQLGLAS